MPQTFSEEERKDSSRNRGSQNMSSGGLEPSSMCTLRLIVQHGTTEPATAAAETSSNFCYLCDNLINVYCG